MKLHTKIGIALLIIMLISVFSVLIPFVWNIMGKTLNSWVGFIWVTFNLLTGLSGILAITYDL